MEGKKQTAIEWLEKELKDKLGTIVINKNWELMESLFNQAKEMGKQQINSNKCYHPLTERKHTSDTNFECTICGYNNY